MPRMTDGATEAIIPDGSVAYMESLGWRVTDSTETPSEPAKKPAGRAPTLAGAQTNGPATK